MDDLRLTTPERFSHLVKCPGSDKISNAPPPGLKREQMPD